MNKPSKRNHRYHTKFVKFLKKAFPDYDRRKLIRNLWNARTQLRKKYPYAMYPIGFRLTNWVAELEDGTPFYFVNFDDFIARYLALDEPFFLMDDVGLIIKPDTI